MNFITNLYNRILEAIQEIQSSIESIQKFLESFHAIVSAILQFLKPIFNFIPWEVWLLLFIVILLLNWVNNLFPTTPRMNYSILVVFILILWGYTYYQAFPNEPVPYFKIVRAGVYLLLPVYIVSLLSFGIQKGIQLYQKKKRTKIKDLNDFIEKFHIESRRLLATSELLQIGEESPQKWKEQVEVISHLIENAKKWEIH